MSNSVFDPSKAEFGPLSGGMSYNHWGSNSASTMGSRGQEYVGRNSGTSDEEVSAWYNRSFEEEDDQVKEASSREYPSEPFYNMDDDPVISRYDDLQHIDVSPDLNVHEAPSVVADASDRIAERIKKMQSRIRKNVQLNDKTEIKSPPENPEPIPTKTEVNREDFDINHIGLKTASAMDVLSDPSLNPIKAWLLVTEAWGEEWFEWEPETIIQTAQHDGFEIDAINLSKLFAIRAILKTDEFYEDVRVFEKVCIAFSSRIVDWSTTQHARIFEIASTIALVERYVREHEFSMEIAASLPAPLPTTVNATTDAKP